MQIVYIRSANIYDESRATKEIISLASAGHHVHVLGWNRNGSASEKVKEVFSKFSSSVSFDFYDNTLDPQKGNSITKLLAWDRWVLHTLKHIKNVDVVHACDFDSGFAAWRYCKAKKKTLVYDIYDYYIDAHHVPKPLELMIESLEIKIINYAQTTIICTEERREQISKSTPKNLVVICNSPDVSDVVSQEEKYDYAYCGSLCDRRLLGEILNIYKDNKKLKMLFAGNGAFKEKLLEISDKFDNVTYLGSIPYADVLKYESASKVISAIYDPVLRNHRLCAPNKFYEAMALGKPIIVCKGTGIDKVVDANNIGIVIDYDAEQFYAALEMLVSNDALRADMGIRAKALYEAQYKWSVMEQRLIALYDGLEQSI